MEASFRRGALDAVPIGIGYFGVGFAVAAAAIANGHPVWSPVLQSLTHLSGTDQGAFSQRSIPGEPGGALELALLCFALNLRYLLLALALAQKLPPQVGFAKRMCIAMGVTDENVALAISRPFPISFRYTLGILATSYFGWNAGNAIGAVGASILPPSALTPLGVALYAMFIAIVVPEAKKSRTTALCAAIAGALNIALSALPSHLRPPPVFSMLLSGILGAGIATFALPLNKGREP